MSDFSKQLLDSVWHQPLFDLTCVGKTLCSRVKELDKFRVSLRLHSSSHCHYLGHQQDEQKRGDVSCTRCDGTSNYCLIFVHELCFNQAFITYFLIQPRPSFSKHDKTACDYFHH